MYSELITHNDTSVIEAIIHADLLNIAQFRNGCEPELGMLMTELNFRSWRESAAKDKSLRIVCGLTHRELFRQALKHHRVNPKKMNRNSLLGVRRDHQD